MKKFIGITGQNIINDIKKLLGKSEISTAELFNNFNKVERGFQLFWGEQNEVEQPNRKKINLNGEKEENFAKVIEIEVSLLGTDKTVFQSIWSRI